MGFLYAYIIIRGRLHIESQWVIVDVCLCAVSVSQGAGAAEEELCHRHCQEKAGGRICCEYSQAGIQLFVVCGDN